MPSWASNSVFEKRVLCLSRSILNDLGSCWWCSCDEENPIKLMYIPSKQRLSYDSLAIVAGYAINHVGEYFKDADGVTYNAPANGTKYTRPSFIDKMT